RGVDHQERRLVVAKEVVVVGLCHALEVRERDRPLPIAISAADPIEQDLRTGLEVNDEIGQRDAGIEQRVDAIVERELLFVEREVREDSILRKDVVADRRLPEEILLLQLELLLIAREQEEHLRLKREATLVAIELLQEGIV